MFSEKTQRELEKYIRRLVKGMPRWLRDLLEEERVCFCVDDNGTITLAMDESIAKGTEVEAQRLIAKYMRRHPNACLKATVPH